jgi:tetratricopeptide (TPR) repeat protein
MNMPLGYSKMPEAEPPIWIAPAGRSGSSANSDHRRNNIMSNEFLKDHPELEKLFERLTAEPGSHVFAPLADSCRKIGRLEEALEICRNGVERHPEYASGQVVLGKCHYDRGDMDGARTTFQKVLSLDENNLVALKYLGMILAEQGDRAAAMEHFKHILALDPDNVEIRTKLESLQGAKEESAVPVEDEAEDAGPVGEINEKDEEILILDQILEDEFEGDTIRLGDEEETSDELATLTLADIYASQGYVHKAKSIYEEVLHKWPDHSQAKAKLAALDLDNAEPAVPVEDETEPDEETMMEDFRTDESDTRSENYPAGQEEPIDSGPGEDDADPGDEDTPPGRKPIDSGSDIEKFKKWLQRMND